MIICDARNGGCGKVHSTEEEKKNPVDTGKPCVVCGKQAWFKPDFNPSAGRLPANLPQPAKA